MTMTNIDTGSVLLGSGELYLGVVPNPETASEATIQAALTNVGAISGGAELTYKPTVYEVESANRGMVARFPTKEEVTFKTGIITWNLDNLAMVAPAYETISGTTKRIGIGGNTNIPTNYLRFVHTKADGKTLTVNVFKAQSTEGFTLAFAKDKEISIDAQFKALATNATNGNLVEIVEEVGTNMATVTALNFTTKTNSSLPAVLVVTGTDFMQNSIVYLENTSTGVKTNLRTFYDSPTQLSALLQTAMAVDMFKVKVRTGQIESTTSVNLTFA